MNKSLIHIIIKKLLFSGIILLLFIPILAQFKGWFEFKPLAGAYEKTKNPAFDKSLWFEGTYQEKKEAFINDDLFIKPLFVRLYNQYFYSLYNSANARSVIVGKSEYLYEEYYITAYLGRDFIGKEAISEKTDKLQKIADTLKSKNIELIIIIAPGKASYYPEYIPERYNPKHLTINDFDVYNEMLLESNLHYLDFKTWFVNIKSTTAYPLFPKTGIHWSKYGEVLAADSILNYINSISKDKKVPRLMIDETIFSTTMKDTDDDIEKGMNLLYDIPDLRMAYPKISWQEDTLVEQPKILTVADSYYWGMFNFGLSQKAFNGGQFWFYNQTIYPDNYEKPSKVEDVDIVEEVEKNDRIILMSNEANLYKFAFGFIDQLYAGYFESEEKD